MMYTEQISTCIYAKFAHKIYAILLSRDFLKLRLNMARLLLCLMPGGILFQTVGPRKQNALFAAVRFRCGKLKF